MNTSVSAEERAELLTDSEGDDSDSSETAEPPAKKRFVPGEKILSLLQSDKPLKNERRKTLLGKHPILVIDQAHPPEAEAALVPRAAKSHDKFLSRLQRYTLDAMGPMTWLLDQVQQGTSVDPKIGKEAIKTSISLLGNASAHFNLERRKAVLKQLYKDLKPLVERGFPDRGAFLFGQNTE